MSLERIFNALISLGLSQMDARVYIHLAVKGSAKAREIISDLAINKSQIYLSLKRLQNQGLITTSSENPSIFCAFPFEVVLDMLLVLKEEQAKGIKASRKELLSSWRVNKK